MDDIPLLLSITDSISEYALYSLGDNKYIILEIRMKPSYIHIRKLYNLDPNKSPEKSVGEWLYMDYSTDFSNKVYTYLGLDSQHILNFTRITKYSFDNKWYLGTNNEPEAADCKHRSIALHNYVCLTARHHVILVPEELQFDRLLPKELAYECIKYNAKTPSDFVINKEFYNNNYSNYVHEMILPFKNVSVWDDLIPKYIHTWALCGVSEVKTNKNTYYIVHDFKRSTTGRWDDVWLYNKNNRVVKKFMYKQVKFYKDMVSSSNLLSICGITGEEIIDQDSIYVDPVPFTAAYKNYYRTRFVIIDKTIDLRVKLCIVESIKSLKTSLPRIVFKEYVRRLTELYKGKTDTKYIDLITSLV